MKNQMTSGGGIGEIIPEKLILAVLNALNFRTRGFKSVNLSKSVSHGTPETRISPLAKLHKAIQNVPEWLLRLRINDHMI